MDSYFLFRENKRVTLKEPDMTADKISRIFQVDQGNLYISDDANMAIFPSSNGHFDRLELQMRGRYEVHGESTVPKETQPSAPSRFSFFRPTAAATSSAAAATASSLTRHTASRSSLKTFQRNIYIADVLEGHLETNKTLNVRFSEFEATVDGIQTKVQEALDEEEMVLTDGQGKKILDSEGTRGSSFWRQSARKIFAIKEVDFQNLKYGKKRRLSKQDDTGLDGVMDKIEEVILAAEELKQVSSSIEKIVELTKSSAKAPTISQADALKAAFSCIICKDFLVDPMTSSCCQSIIGCQQCILEWQSHSPFCPHCREGDFAVNTRPLHGLSEALGALKDMLK
ncbi:unnamed protein product [Knipowitschia caucasica]